MKQASRGGGCGLGRYLSERDYLIWIELRGGPTRQWVWYNGVSVEAATIEDDAL
ncbi:MAG: hypothetical protein H6573_33010 [Lewinellaceae bacterium]|nr:hypothetical protein [Phaeodactylibacter sp.]MCB0615035.1 hypothetical protein [Phaeodactylibacter sp.]MCB9352276.1 hypothetical protein [Lewinellaceae bacterium]